MYRPKTGIKADPERRWTQPDRIFFGFGACHILAGVFLDQHPRHGFYAEWIIPNAGYSGAHFYATNGQIAFDFHGYSERPRLLKHYWAGYQARYPGWDARIERVQFSLLDQSEMNARNHLGPDQYYGDPIARAKTFIAAKRCPAALEAISA